MGIRPMVHGGTIRMVTFAYSAMRLWQTACKPIPTHLLSIGFGCPCMRHFSAIWEIDSLPDKTQKPLGEGAFAFTTKSINYAPSAAWLARLPSPAHTRPR